MIFQPKHTKSLVLFRTNYAESDRIATFLTKDFGKIKAIVKGARKERSKLASGVELFSVSDIGFIAGRGELSTLVSARLINNYCNFLDDLAKVDFGFNCLKTINKITADDVDGQYFDLVERLFQALEDKSVSLESTCLWWHTNISQLTGHGLNLRCLKDGGDFTDDNNFSFDCERGCFLKDPKGNFSPNHIKYMRLSINHLPRTLSKVKDGDELAKSLNSAMQNFVEYHQL